jgi:hypothetical protein
MLGAPMGALARRAACSKLARLAVLLAIVAGAASALAASSIDELPARAIAVDRAIGSARVAIALAALVLWAGRLGRGRPARRAAVGVLGLAAFASNFNFFVWTGLHKHELFHYYLGSKYFPELGYFRLYECSVAALYPDAHALPPALAEITDLRSKERRPAAEVLARAAPCRDDFSPERWSAFERDVEAFRRIMGDRGIAGAVRDHGYNPSPAWTLVGRPLATLVPATPPGLWLIARIDLWLLLGLFGAIGWAFGFEAMCLAAVAWGACGHTRYQWTGDAFLRQLWLACSIGSICLLRRGRPALAGALLAFASVERVFPALFFAGYGLQRLGHLARERRLAPGTVAFAGGAALAAVVAAGAGTFVAGRGAAVWGEFADNLVALNDYTARNGLGLKYLASFRASPPPGVVVPSDPEELEVLIQRVKGETLTSRRWLYGGALLAFALLFARAAWLDPGRLADWEALAMGAAMIPILTVPASYYLGFAIALVPLALRRPAIGTALLLAVASWGAAVLVYQERALAYAWSSAALLALCAFTLLALQRPAAAPPKLPETASSS